MCAHLRDTKNHGRAQILLRLYSHHAALKKTTHSRGIDNSQPCNTFSNLQHIFWRGNQSKEPAKLSPEEQGLANAFVRKSHRGISDSSHAQLIISILRDVPYPGKRLQRKWQCGMIETKQEHSKRKYIPDPPQLERHVRVAVWRSKRGTK